MKVHDDQSEIKITGSPPVFIQITLLETLGPSQYSPRVLANILNLSLPVLAAAALDTGIFNTRLRLVTSKLAWGPLSPRVSKRLCRRP